MNFTNGATSITLLNSCEWPGLALCFYSMLLTNKGRRICSTCFKPNPTSIDQDEIERCHLSGGKVDLHVIECCSEGFVYDPDDHMVQPNGVHGDQNGNLDNQDQDSMDESLGDWIMKIWSRWFLI